MRFMLEETTARHMQADVPVAAFLSGGKEGGSKIDETAAAAEIARHLGCEHFVLPLQPDEAIQTLPEILGCYDEPFADPAAIPTWYLSKLAAEHVKVVLCGEGGDELFAGYKRHRNARAIERFRPVMGVLSALATLIATLPATPSSRLNSLRQHAGRFAEFVQLPDGYQQFFAATQTSSSQVRRTVFTGDFGARTELDDDYARLEAEYFPPGMTKTASALEQFLLADLTLNMPSAMLTRLDRASMAHSLEARVPFLSHKMVDFALTVPEDLKLRGATGKLILRRAIATWLPSSVMRRPKQGFQIPHQAWLRGAFGGFAREIWHDSGAACAGYLDVAKVDRLFQEHQRGEANHGRLLYTIAAFAIWWANSYTPKQVAAA
jgi:asparagine synthase (glutamine-hydrolysing)